MLVLSRRSNDKICLPQLDITIHFIRVQSGTVKVGVEAPREIQILRDDVVPDPTVWEPLRRITAQLSRETRHAIRNGLHTIMLGVHLYKEQMRMGLTDEAEETFSSIQESLRELDQQEVLQRPDTSPPARNASPETVLVVEDEPNERELLTGFLRLKGFHTLSFPDGVETLAYLASNATPRAVLLDMKMDRCDGPTVVRQLRADAKHKHTRVYAVSGTSPAENGLETGPLGVDGWFPKPVRIEHLLDALSQVPQSQYSCAAAPSGFGTAD